jgi:serine/threonine-protein kinase RsbT
VRAASDGQGSLTLLARFATPTSLASQPRSTAQALPARALEGEERMTESIEHVRTVLLEYLPSSIVDAVLESSVRRARIDLQRVESQDVDRLAQEMHRSLRLFISQAGRVEDCMRRVRAVVSGGERPLADLVVIPIQCEDDIVVVRNTTRDACRQIGFSDVLQTRVATAVSELARNIHRYARRGSVELRRLKPGRPGIEVIACDKGPGIANLELILSGAYRSPSGMGVGLIATKRVMDHFDVKTSPGAGTTITIRKYRE